MLPPCAGSSPHSAWKASTPSACSAVPALTPISPALSVAGHSRPPSRKQRGECRSALGSVRWAPMSSAGTRTDEAVRLAQDAKAIRADAGLLAPVSYTPLTDGEVFEHFATVARESRLPLCIYDNPSTTHFKFSPTLVGRLSQLPGIIAVKCPAPEPHAI